MSNSTVDKTANALKYLPIEVSAVYFHSLPDSVVDNMYSWCLNDTFYKDYRTKEQKASYICAFFSIPSTDAGRFDMYNQLKFYILNDDE